MDPYNFNPYAQQGFPMGRMGPQGMAPGGMPPGGPGGPMGGPGMPGPGAGGGGAPFPAGGPGGPAQAAPQGVGGIQAGLQNGPPQPTGPMPPPGGGGMSPEMVQEMIALRSGGTALGAADKQQALADQLRNDARGRLDAKRLPSSTGGMVVAPTWGAALGSVADQYRAHKLDESAGAMRKEVDSKREAAGTKLYDALKKGGGYGSLIAKE